MSKHQPGTDDENFRRTIGWQSPEAPLPDDYEEQLLERLFAEGGPQLSAGPVSLRPVARVPATVRWAREAVSPPPPLVDTPPVSPKITWRPSRRMTMVLAAAAAIALVGVQQLPASQTALVAAPRLVPELPELPATPAPEAVEPLAPERLSCSDADPDAPCSDDGHPSKPEPAEIELPDPGAQRLARREVTPSHNPSSTQMVDQLPRGGAMQDGRAHDGWMQLAAFGAVSPTTGDGSPWGWNDCGMAACGMATVGPASLRDFDPDAGHAEVAAAIVDDQIPLPAGGVDKPPPPSLLPAPPRPVAQPAIATLAPGDLGPRWLGLGVSLPRDVQTTVPAGIRVVGAIDISKTHRRLQF